jgi:hypothetical protein
MIDVGLPAIDPIGRKVIQIPKVQKRSEGKSGIDVVGLSPLREDKTPLPEEGFKGAVVKTKIVFEGPTPGVLVQNY